MPTRRNSDGAEDGSEQQAAGDQQSPPTDREMLSRFETLAAAGNARHYAGRAHGRSRVRALSGMLLAPTRAEGHGLSPQVPSRHLHPPSRTSLCLPSMAQMYMLQRRAPSRFTRASASSENV